MPGPIPNREADLARPRTRKGKDVVPVTKGVARKVRIPRADPNWHPIAKMLYKSLKESGQSDWYQNSDWAFAYSLCEDLSEYKNPNVDRNGVLYTKRSGQMLQTIYSAMERLLVAEGDRRRVRIELHEPEPEVESAAVLAIADYKADLDVED
jgi:hypothetical protein